MLERKVWAVLCRQQYVWWYETPGIFYTKCCMTTTATAFLCCLPGCSLSILEHGDCFVALAKLLEPESGRVRISLCYSHRNLRVIDQVDMYTLQAVDSVVTLVRLFSATHGGNAYMCFPLLIIHFVSIEIE